MGVRYLEKRAPHKATSLQLGFLLNGFGCAALLLTSLPLWAVEAWRRRKSARPPGAWAASGGGGACEIDGSSVRQRRRAVGDAGLGEPLLQQQQAGPTYQRCEASGDDTAARSGWRRQALMLCGTTGCLMTLFLTQVFSLLFTHVGGWGGGASRGTLFCNDRHGRYLVPLFPLNCMHERVFVPSPYSRRRTCPKWCSFCRPRLWRSWRGRCSGEGAPPACQQRVSSPAQILTATRRPRAVSAGPPRPPVSGLRWPAC